METASRTIETRKAGLSRIIVDAFTHGALDGLDTVYAPDMVRYQPPFEALEGLVAFKGYLEAVRAAYTGFGLVVTEAIAEGEWTLLQVRVSGTHSGQSPVLPIEPSGRPMEITGAILSRWEAGKIVEEWAHIDYLGLFQQLGVVPAPKRD